MPALAEHADKVLLPKLKVLDDLSRHEQVFRQRHVGHGRLHGGERDVEPACR